MDFGRLKLKRHRHIAPDRREAPACHRRLLLVRESRFRPRRQRFDMLINLLNRPILTNQLLGRLIANACHAGNIIRGVPPQALVVRQQLRPKTKSFLHGWFVIRNRLRWPFTWHQHAYIRINQLQRIHISRHNHHGHVLTRLSCNRADHIICLKPCLLKNGNIKRAHHVAYQVKLNHQVIIGLSAVSFIVGKFLMPKRWPLQIKRRGNVRRLEAREHFQQRRRKPKHRIRWRAIIGRHRRQRMIRPMDESV